LIDNFWKLSVDEIRNLEKEEKRNRKVYINKEHLKLSVIYACNKLYDIDKIENPFQWLNAGRNKMITCSRDLEREEEIKSIMSIHNTYPLYRDFLIDNDLYKADINSAFLYTLVNLKGHIGDRLYNTDYIIDSVEVDQCATMNVEIEMYYQPLLELFVSNKYFKVVGRKKVKPFERLKINDKIVFNASFYLTGKNYNSINTFALFKKIFSDFKIKQIKTVVHTIIKMKSQSKRNFFSLKPSYKKANALYLDIGKSEENYIKVLKKVGLVALIGMFKSFDLRVRASLMQLFKALIITTAIEIGELLAGVTCDCFIAKTVYSPVTGEKITHLVVDRCYNKAKRLLEFSNRKISNKMLGGLKTKYCKSSEFTITDHRISEQHIKYYELPYDEVRKELEK